MLIRGQNYAPIPGQLCTECGQEISISHVTDIFQSISGTDLAVTATCGRCGAQNPSVILRLV
jgi:hypothetical protein